MESVKTANILKETCEENEQESPISMQSGSYREILQSEDCPVPVFRGLIFALPISLLMWGTIIWIFL
jgi:hypothetical protein